MYIPSPLFSFCHIAEVAIKGVLIICCQRCPSGKTRALQVFAGFYNFYTFLKLCRSAWISLQVSESVCMCLSKYRQTSACVSTYLQVSEDWLGQSSNGDVRIVGMLNALNLVSIHDADGPPLSVHSTSLSSCTTPFLLPGWQRLLTGVAAVGTTSTKGSSDETAHFWVFLHLDPITHVILSHS